MGIIVFFTGHYLHKSVQNSILTTEFQFRRIYYMQYELTNDTNYA